MLQALRLRLQNLALESIAATNGAPFERADLRLAETAALVTQSEIFAEIDRAEKRLLLPARSEHLQDYLQKIREWEVGREPFEINDAARQVRIASLKLGIRSRRHSEEEAIDASVGVKYDDLPIIEKRAVEIVLGRRRAAKNNKMEIASRLANEVRREWIAAVPPIKRSKGKPLSVATIVRIAVPRLDKLAGKEIVAGIPTSQDPAKMKSPGFAALYAIIRLSYGMVSSEHIYKSLVETRRESRAEMARGDGK